MCSDALSCFKSKQQLLREPLFHPNLESDDEQFWLPSQLTRAISSLSTYSEETQLEGLKVLLQCTCLQKWCLSQKTVLSIVQLCLHIYAGGSTATKTAAVATASQAVQAYISFLYESSATSLPDDQDQVQFFFLSSTGFYFLCSLSLFLLSFFSWF